MRKTATSCYPELLRITKQYTYSSIQVIMLYRWISMALTMYQITGKSLTVTKQLY